MPWHDLTRVELVELAALWLSSVVAALRGAVLCRRYVRSWPARRTEWLRGQPARDAALYGGEVRSPAALTLLQGGVIGPIIRKAS